MTRGLLLLLLFPIFVSSDQSCITECFSVSKFSDKLPTCATWLRKDISHEVAGIYELKKGVMNMSCAFASLPTPTAIKFVHKAPNSNSWTEVTCSTKEENKLCSDSEHYVEARCILRTTELSMSGNYRCQAVTNGNTAKETKAFGSEFNVNVVGVSNYSIVDYQLKWGELGHIEVKICANPKPEVFWVTADSILKLDERTNRITTTQLHPQKLRPREDGPAMIVPYCYVARLIIRKVEETDHFQLAVRTDGTTQYFPLDLRVTDVPVQSASRSSFLTLFLAALSLRGIVF